MEEKEPKKAILFIDGNNFYYKLKDAIADKEDSILLNFDYKGFARKLVKQNILIGTYYYIGAVRRQNGPNKEKSEKMYAGQQKLIASLQRQGVTVVLGSLIQHPDKSFHEKGVDVRIAVEMIRFAREGKYDVAYLLSSDTDLVPAVEEVRSFDKKEVVYVGVSKGQSFGLTKAADNTILLREDDILPFVPQRHRMKLQQNPFDKIRRRTKVIEVRLFDEKRELLKVGDEIEFMLIKDRGQKIRTKVIELIRTKTFLELFELYAPEIFGAKDKQDLLNIYNYYKKEDEEKYGVLGIKLECLE